MEFNTLKKLMRNITAVFCFLLLSANGCKSPGADVNPQVDDQEVSTLFSQGTSIGELQIAELDEASGLVNSRSNPIYLWSHNDSGGFPALYLFTKEGADSSRLEFSGAQNIDWEDLASGPGPDDLLNYLYVGDIGDNNARRSQLTIYRVPEPDLTVEDIPSTFVVASGDYDAIDFVYEDGARDAEALFVEPQSKDIYIVTKREPSVILYRLPFPQSTTELNTAERVMVLPYTFITAADISPSGDEVLIKNYLNIYHWKKSGNESLTELLATEPDRLNYEQEPQGEAIAWSVDGSAFFTISESDGSNPVVIYSYSRN